MFSFKSMLLIDYETLMRAWSSQPSCTHSFIHPHLGSMYPCTVQRSTHWHRDCRALGRQLAYLASPTQWTLIQANSRKSWKMEC